MELKIKYREDNADVNENDTLRAANIVLQLRPIFFLLYNHKQELGIKIFSFTYNSQT